MEDRERDVQYPQESGLPFEPQLRPGQEAPESRFYDLDDACFHDRPGPTAVLWAVSGRVEQGKKQAGVMGTYALYLQNDGAMETLLKLLAFGFKKPEASTLLSTS